MREEFELGYCNFGEWRIWSDNVLDLDPTQNRLEQLVLIDQQNYLGTALAEQLAGLVPIGTAGNGDVYFVFLNAAQPDQAEVLLWDHEESRLVSFAGFDVYARASQLVLRAPERRRGRRQHAARRGRSARAREGARASRPAPLALVALRGGRREQRDGGRLGVAVGGAPLLHPQPRGFVRWSRATRA